MTLTHRLLRRLGYDVTKELELTKPRYEYTITHLNGKTNTYTANEHYHDDGFLILVDIPSVHEVSLGAGRLSPPWKYSHWDTVAHLEGVEEYERTKIGEDRWTATWSKADGSLTDITHEFDGSCVGITKINQLKITEHLSGIQISNLCAKLENGDCEINRVESDILEVEYKR